MESENELRRLTSTKPVLKGKLQLPGDKSISHRAIMLGSLAQGKTVVYHLLQADDVLTTINIYRQLGVSIKINEEMTEIQGLAGFEHFKKPNKALDFGNSGTTLRLSLGILACQPFEMDLIGDASLSNRPMARVLDPLRTMGLKTATSQNQLPIQLKENDALQAINYTLPIASAQVKSALIFAALQAKTPSTIVEPSPSRNHTETMLTAFGVELQRQENQLVIMPHQKLTGTTLTVPGDFSSAAFFVVGALLLPGSEIKLVQVGLNQSRIGLLRALDKMGGTIEIENLQSHIGEPYGTLKINEQRPLKAVEIVAEDVPSMVDELPLLVLAATQANGTTKITGAGELRYKETDRIQAVTEELNRLGANIIELMDGFMIKGPTKLRVDQPTLVHSHGDHRIGMMLAIAALITEGDVYLDDAAAINISYPSFFSDLTGLLK